MNCSGESEKIFVKDLLFLLRFGSVLLTAPSGPPTEVKVKIVKKRTLAFTWEEPACGERNGPITGYDYSLHDWQGNTLLMKFSLLLCYLNASIGLHNFK